MKVAFWSGAGLSGGVSAYVAAIGATLALVHNCKVVLGSTYISNHKLQDYFSSNIKEEGVAVGMINCLHKIGRLDIGLFAVAEEARGRGYGRNLLSAVEFFAHECRVDEISVSTQLENIPAMSLYQAMGYKIFETQQVYHIWNKKEEKTNENPF